MSSTLEIFNNKRSRDEEEAEEVNNNNNKRVRSSFSEDVVFAFFSKSVDAIPGKGKQELLANGRESSEFADLAKIRDWRKCLSNFYESEFTLDGLRWLSVEHYYHASKFRNSNPDFYRLFSLDSEESTFNRDTVLAKAAGGKTGIFNKGNKEKQRVLRPKKILADSDFFKGRQDKEMQKAQYAKFSQNPDLKSLLLATKDAKLDHIMRGGKVTFYTLMNVREQLSNE